MDAPPLVFELTLDDYRALQRHICRPVKWPPLAQLVLVWLATLSMILAGLSFLPSAESFMVGFFAGLILYVGYVMVMARRVRAVTDPLPNGSILCRQEYSFEDEGLRHRTPHWEGLTRWSGIIRVDETEHHLFLMIDRAAAYTFPKRAFASPADAASFVEHVRARLSGR